jgi:hypothetical protein
MPSVIFFLKGIDTYPFTPSRCVDHDILAEIDAYVRDFFVTARRKKDEIALR